VTCELEAEEELENLDAELVVVVGSAAAAATAGVPDEDADAVTVTVLVTVEAMPWSSSSDAAKSSWVNVSGPLGVNTSVTFWVAGSLLKLVALADMSSTSSAAAAPASGSGLLGVVALIGETEPESIKYMNDWLCAGSAGSDELWQGMTVIGAGWSGEELYVAHQGTTASLRASVTRK